MPHLEHENLYGRLQGLIVAGADEVGRGPLAGPVVAGAVILPAALPASLAKEVNDSKALTPKKREKLFPLIEEHCIWAVAEASVAEIDSINILQASLLAMQRAIEKLGIAVHTALIDGNKIPRLPCKAVPIIKGDAHSLSIAAASIMAKVTRDRLMQRLHEEFPHYGWAGNAGYPTPDHLAALMVHGVTPHHRQSFAPVRKALEIAERNAAAA